ncbi:MAG: hypothetical protein JSV88_09950, partial [Candidatus Aminicenantes bacterium]
ALQKQSLIDSFRLPEGKFHSLHRIVQDVVRDCGLNRSGKKEWCQAAVQLLLEHFPFDPRNAVISPLSKTLLPHALSVISHAKRLSLNTDEVINLTDKTYLCNGILQSDEGKPEDSLKSIRKVRGFRQPHSTTMRARCLDVMGDCYHIRDKYEKAKSHLDEARKIWRTQKEYEAFQRASERLAQVHELSGDLFKAKTLIQDTIKVVSVEAPGTHIFSSIYYREGVLARLFFELNNSLDSYRKSLHAAKREKNEVWQAYAKRGLGEIALLQGRLKHAEKHLEEAIKLFEKTKHRGKVWIMRFQAEIQRQKAFKPKISHEEKNRLLGMAEKKYRDYIEKCKDMKNPNGEAWGWLRLAFLLLEREVVKETCRSREKSSAWTCIIKSEKLFKKTGSGIGSIEVIISKGLAMAAGLCPEPGEKIKLLLEDARNRAQWKHLSKQLTILGHLISHSPGSPLSGPLWKEIRSPRNPT